MTATTGQPPHVVAGFTVPRVLFQVLLALVPVTAVQAYLFGLRPLLLIAVAAIAALACEALALRLRRRSPQPFLCDGSVLVTAVLLALAVPPTLPVGLLVFGIAVAVLVGKHAYGGLGQNPFNPAMVGYAVLLVSFPLEMTRWPVPGGGWDAMTGATALDTLRTGLRQSYTMQEIFAGPAFGRVGAAGGEWICLAALAGGLYLLARRVIRWHIPAAMLAGVAAPAALFHMFDPGANASATFHLAAGATALGAFFGQGAQDHTLKLIGLRRAGPHGYRDAQMLRVGVLLPDIAGRDKGRAVLRNGDSSIVLIQPCRFTLMLALYPKPATGHWKPKTLNRKPDAGNPPALRRCISHYIY